MAIVDTMIRYFQTYGVLDFILPFILVFTIVYAVLQKAKILGDDKKNFNIIISIPARLLVLKTYLKQKSLIN